MRTVDIKLQIGHILVYMQDLESSLLRKATDADRIRRALAAVAVGPDNPRPKGAVQLVPSSPGLR
jgi:hypothetical protein